jgi:hypothetical protein
MGLAVPSLQHGPEGLGHVLTVPVTMATKTSTPQPPGPYGIRPQKRAFPMKLKISIRKKNPMMMPKGDQPAGWYTTVAPSAIAASAAPVEMPAL